ncbi:hypothetical protein SD70_31390 [Gordoniibacillus kamchatkensis]|uniref:HTH cro/C1-type domain-containing protein n=1 Tax=Gordoniibacillus kamchatkensis TaxID=1590651 RepID=A0ABR5A6P6_9BACL|nr:helix-turn-helix transcriptional regulator [Paenibacillus sp. VKM B-2647]KIL36750.1 hypothetical protein SD70_31390 [Paenibacillus sp. VKM B-2647]
MAHFYLQVANNIRFYRRAANLTQEQLSEIVGIDRSYLGKIERGEVNISLETVVRIAEALKISPYDLFERNKNTRRSANKELMEKINILLSGQSVEELRIIHSIINNIRTYKDLEIG